MTNGNHPFGAILVDDKGKVLFEAENGYMPAQDGTAHAERLLASKACRDVDAGDARESHALFLRRALRHVRRRDVLGRHRPPRLWPERTSAARRYRQPSGEPHARPALPHVFASGQRPTEVVGPLLEDEAEAVHEGAWTNSHGRHGAAQYAERARKTAEYAALFYSALRVWTSNAMTVRILPRYSTSSIGFQPSDA